MSWDGGVHFVTVLHGPFLGDKLGAKGDALFTGAGLDTGRVCILDPIDYGMKSSMKLGHAKQCFVRCRRELWRGRSSAEHAD